MGYRLGLDIGITSVGWAVIDMEVNGITTHPCKIRDLGVRLFDKAENPKTGASLALPRREARSARRRTRRSRHRIMRVKQLLDRYGVLTRAEILTLYSDSGRMPDVWRLRIDALDRRLANDEFCRVLVHIAQRRGFRSNRKGDIQDQESGELLEAVSLNRKRMTEGNYRTVSEMLVKVATVSSLSGETYIESIRNKNGDYSLTVSRDLIEQEVTAIFDAQRSMGNTVASTTLEEQYLNILLSQRSFDDGPGGDSPYSGGVSGMVGQCTFVKDEKRAPVSSFSFERFRILQAVNNLRIDERLEMGARRVRVLRDDERALLVSLAYKKPKLMYSDVRQALNLSDRDLFGTLNYSIQTPRNKTESSVFCALKYYHELKKQLKSIGVTIDYLSPKNQDEIGQILSLWKSDANRKQRLTNLDLPPHVADVLLPISASKFGHLSFKALGKLLPHMEQGLRYDEACRVADLRLPTYELTTLLPPMDDSVTNPVVRRGLSQAIKVINAIIRKYGSPDSIHVELAREMSKSLRERRETEKRQSDRRDDNEAIRQKILELGVNPSWHDIVKYRLYEEQQCKCLYSGVAFDIRRLFEPGYAEVDHIVPYGVSFDDSYNNKVLVLAAENRRKGYQTPLEYMADDPVKANRFVATVNALHLNPRKKQNLLIDVGANQLEENGFRERNLNDTRYITRAMAQHIENHLLFSGESPANKKVVCVNGVVTAYLRKRWGLEKNRDENDLHHAMDAAVVACVGDSLIQAVTRTEKFKYRILSNRDRYTVTLVDSQKVYVDRLTGESFAVDSLASFLTGKMVLPWNNFSQELLARLSNQPGKVIHSLKLPTYSIHEPIWPVFVSRMPRRRVTGAAHKDTVRGLRTRRGEKSSDAVVVSRVPLTSLKLDANGEISRYFNPQDDKVVYEGLKQRLIEHGGDANKAFKEPFFKTSRDSKKRTPVCKVKVMDRVTLGVAVHGGTAIAENETMIRIDVFEKSSKFYYVPVYVSDVVRADLPRRLATVSEPYDNWRRLDETFDFKFSLYPNDLVLISKEGASIKLGDGRKEPLGTRLMYYQKADIANAAATFGTHDGSGEIRIGLQGLKRLEKYVVDYLGGVHPVRQEYRLGFRKKRGQSVS